MFRILPALFFCSFALFGQRTRETNVNSWWVYAGDHPIKGPWGVFAEIQVRRSDFVQIEQQVQLRDAVTYRISPNAHLSARV